MLSTGKLMIVIRMLKKMWRIKEGSNLNHLAEVLTQLWTNSKQIQYKLYLTILYAN